MNTMNKLLQTLLITSILAWGLVGVPAVGAESASPPTTNPKTVETPPTKPSLAELLTPLIKQHRGEVGVVIKHLPTGETFAWREDKAMPTASLIKLPLMMATYQAVADGKVKLDQTITLTKEDQVPGSGVLTTTFSPGLQLSLRDAVRLMISVSDNTATNLVIDQVGLGATNELMQSLGCSETRLNSKVYRRNTSNDLTRSKKFGLGSTTAADQIKLLELLHSKTFVGEESSTRMLEHLYSCVSRSKVPRHLSADVKIAHKTGSVGDTRCDAGLIDSPVGMIAFCVLTTANVDKSWGDTNEAELLAAEIGLTAYKYFVGDTEPATPQVARVLQLGAQGDLVESLQRTLNARLKPSPGIGVDGDFGPNTESAVLLFQKQAKLKTNGLVDRDVWKALGPLVTEDQPAPAPEVVNGQQQKKQPLESLDGPPVVTCKAWAFVDVKSGELLAGDNADGIREPASTTKLMTAYLVLTLAEEKPSVLDQIITFSTKADKTPGSTSGVKAGEKLPVSELLYGLMLPSGNDAAYAFAVHFGEQITPDSDKPSFDRFIAAMNAMAEKLGMENTHYENPHGLTAKGHVTTAIDLTKLARAALELPSLRKIVSTRQHGVTVESVTGYQRNLVWRNSNRLLKIEGYLGVKTGTTGPAGACLVACSKREGREIIGVVLGSSSGDGRYSDIRNLYRWVWNEQLAAKTNTSANENRAPIQLTDHARKLHASALVIDGHNDMPWEIRKNGSSDFTKLDISKPQPQLQTDIPRLRQGGLGAQFWSVWVPVEMGYSGTALGTTIEQIELVKMMVAHYPNDFELALTADDIDRAHQNGRIASLIGVEGGHCIEESLANLNNLYRLGARYMTLTHSDTLSWADSGTDESKHGGLTDFGIQVVKRMNHLGMMVDISHVSPETMHDALDATSAPVIFSHSSAKAVANSPRNVPDDVLKRVAENDGIVMVNYFSAFVVPAAADLYSAQLELKRELQTKYDKAEVDKRIARWRVGKPMPRGTIHDVIDHIVHIAKVAGPSHVGLGSDYDGVSVLPTQLDDVSSYPYITQGLIDRGFSDEEIRGILGGNLMRVLRRVEQVAAESKENRP